MRILIVSTDYDTREIFSTALRTAGYDVMELANPNDVAAAARGCGLVITDFPTHLDDGATVTQALRRDRRTRRIKILNATTHATPEEIDGATDAGVDATIVLPAYPASIVEKVRMLLAPVDNLQAPRSGAG